MNISVELRYDPGCPNVDAAREALRRAFATLGREARWTEVEQNEDDPDRRPSPTVMVDGRTAAGEPQRGAGCRLYRGADGALAGAPSVETLVSALEEVAP